MRWFKRWTPDGDFVVRKVRRFVPDYRAIGGRGGVSTFELQTRRSEQGHLIMLLATVPAMVYAAYHGWHVIVCVVSDREFDRQRLSDHGAALQPRSCSPDFGPDGKLERIIKARLPGLPCFFAACSCRHRPTIAARLHMDQLKQQVAKARRRLMTQQFLGVLPWCWFGTILAAAVAMGAQKLFLPAHRRLAFGRHSGWQRQLALGLLAALIWTSIIRRGQFEAALEIDRRFGLKERVSTALALTAEELNSPCGQALVDDAMQRVSQLDIRRAVSRHYFPANFIAAGAGRCGIAICLLPIPTSFTRAGADVDRAVAQQQIRRIDQAAGKES